MASSSQNRKVEYLFLVLGLLGITWFFIDFSRQWLPTETVTPIAENTAIARNDTLMKNWGYDVSDVQTRVKQAMDEVNVDSLQHIYGLKQIKNTLNKSKELEEPALPLYVTEILQYPKNMGGNAFIKADYSQNGKLVNLIAQRSIVKNQSLSNSELVKTYFDTQSIVHTNKASFVDSLQPKLMAFQEGELPINEQIFVRDALLRRNWGFPSDEQNNETALNLIQSVAQYYVKNSFWGEHEFEWSAPKFIEEELNYYQFTLNSKQEYFGLSPTLTVEVLPAGGLLKLETTYWKDNPLNSRSLISFQSNLFGQVAILLFGVWLLIVFYFRIKARAVDTGPALFAAVFAGFMVPVITSLAILKNVFINEGQLIGELLSHLFAFGLVGAISSVGFFLLTAVSDSITRQYWPEKVITWDSIRQGMLKNKPIGRAILRGVSISGILIGLYILMARLVPNAFLSGKVVFISQVFIFSPLASLLLNLVISVLFVASTYLVIANQFYGRWNKKWLIPIVTGFASLVLNISVVQVLPMGVNFIFSFIVGFILGLFYIRYDFITLTLGYFIFLNFIATAQGWGLPNSPDFNVFLFTALIICGLLAFGIYFVVSGPEQDELTNYVPEYLEKAAQEQRVSQELKIARDIQVVFFPNKIPETKDYDIAAKCEPAFETGGDFYELIKLDKNKIGVAIGDVSGKGIRAAFYMTFIKGVFQSLAKVLSSPKELMIQVNTLFRKNATKGTFITSIYGILDSEKQCFTYIRAGHNKVLYCSVKDAEAVYHESDGLALGMADDLLFERETHQYKLPLSKGDIIVLYTDGIVEAKNSKNHYYGDTRLLELVESNRNKSAEELLNLILSDVKTFFGLSDANDDMTLIVIKA